MRVRLTDRRTQTTLLRYSTPPLLYCNCSVTVPRTCGSCSLTAATWGVRLTNRRVAPCQKQLGRPATTEDVKSIAKSPSVERSARNNASASTGQPQRHELLMVIAIPATSSSPADFGSLASLGCCAVALCCAAPHATARHTCEWAPSHACCTGTLSSRSFANASTITKIPQQSSSSKNSFIISSLMVQPADYAICAPRVLHDSVLLTWCVMCAVVPCRQCVLAELQSRGASSAVRAAHEVESPIPAVEAPIRADCRQSLASQRQH